MFGVEIGVLIQVLTVLTLTSTLVFSATPKGIEALTRLSNWVRTKIFNSEVILEVHHLKKRVSYIEGELGISYEEEDSPLQH